MAIELCSNKNGCWVVVEMKVLVNSNKTKKINACNPLLKLKTQIWETSLPLWTTAHHSKGQDNISLPDRQLLSVALSSKTKCTT